MLYRLLNILCVGCFILSGCKKSNNGQEPESPAVITITTPTSLSFYVNGSTLRIEGDMTDNNVLAQARVEVRNQNTNAILFQQSNVTGNVGYYYFLWDWQITGITTPTPAVVKVIARDKLANEVSKEVNITLDN